MDEEGRGGKKNDRTASPSSVFLFVIQLQMESLPSLPPFVPSVNIGSIKPCARSRVRHASKTTPNPAHTCPFIRRPLMHMALRVIVWLNSFFFFFPRSLSFESFALHSIDALEVIGAYFITSRALICLSIGPRRRSRWSLGILWCELRRWEPRVGAGRSFTDAGSSLSLLSPAWIP